MTSVWIQIAFYLIILIVLAVLLGNYIGKVMNGEKVFLSRLLTPVENGIYKLLRVNQWYLLYSFIWHTGFTRGSSTKSGRLEECQVGLSF